MIEIVISGLCHTGYEDLLLHESREAQVPNFLFSLEKPGPPPRGGIFDGPSLSRNAGVRDHWLCQ
jgi:hypothetical protein